MMEGVMTLWEVSLLCYQMTKNCVGNRNLASVVNNWHNCPWMFLGTSKVMHIFARLIKLIKWFKVNINITFNILFLISMKRFSLN